ncbi:MAG: nucleoside hydrolase [Erysipelotrichaceae bacterium]|nr:nucleoside hydrolase [Erysipelotrichaceae bacterium]
MNKKAIWIDCDTGVDDAFALFTALKIEELDILGISVTDGNTSLDNGFRNTRNVVSLAGKEDIRIYKGANKPLIGKSAMDASEFHGEDGLGGVILPESKAEVERKLAWDALYEAVKNSKEKVTVCAIAPLTNIATAIAKHPDIVDYIEEINMMGGAAAGGNTTCCAEFNVYHDPEAAENIFKSGIPVNMFGLDVTMKVNFSRADIKEMETYGNPVAEALKEMVKYPLAYLDTVSYQNDICLHDTLPILYAVKPELFKGEKCAVYAETQGSITRGKTVTDLWTDFKFEDRHCRLFLDADREEIVKITKEAIKNY